MKIAITSNDRDLNSTVVARFGRARGFIIYNVDTAEFDYVDNSQAFDAPQGAGIQAAKTVINAGAGAIVTGNVGPKAFSALATAGIDMYLVSGGTVREAIDEFRAGRLEKSQGANVEGHW